MTGLLGSILAASLKTSGYHVLGVNRSVIQAKPDHLSFDPTIPGSLNTLLDVIAPDVIINCAAITDVELCEKSPHQAYQGNTKVVESLADWISFRNSSAHLIQISTDHNYDGPGTKAEDDLHITNMYGFSKYGGELAAAAVPSTIIRTNFFCKSTVSHRKSFTDWIFESLKKNQTIYGYSDIFFSPVYVETLVSVIKEIISKPIIGTYNVGSVNGLSKAEFIHKFASEMAMNTDNVRFAKNRDVGSRTRRPSNMIMDSSKIQREIPGLVMPDLLEEIKRVKNDYYIRSK